MRHPADGIQIQGRCVNNLGSILAEFVFDVSHWNILQNIGIDCTLSPEQPEETQAEQ